MEKLQPLITHKFWVIAGLATLIPLVGWMLDPFGTTAGVIDNRIKTIKSTTVEDPNEKPNQHYIDNIEAVNDTLRGRQSNLDELLYEEQAGYHSWPTNVMDSMKGKIFHDPISNDICDHFRGEHYNEVDTMLAKMNRFNWDTGKGVVEVYPKSIPHVDRAKWNDTPPTPHEVWETQEDVWLTRSILDAIKKVIADEGATKLADSPIPEIFKIELRGGSRPKPVVVGEGQGEGQEGGMINPGQDQAASGGAGGLNNAPYSPPGGRGQDDMEGGGGGNQTNFQTDINIDLNTVFGSDAVQASPQGNAEGGGGGQNINPAPAYRGSGEGNNNNKPGRRYVDDALELPYKTRGFYLEVHMQHEKLPHLQAALVSMPWPTELLMVQQVSKLDDNLPPAPGETKGAGGRRPLAFGAGNRNPGFGARTNNFGRPGGRQAFGQNPRPFGVGAQPMGLPGGNFPRRPMRGGGEGLQEGPMGAGNNQEKDPYVAIQNSRDKALEDPGLVKVGIAGLMTIYRSPDEIKRNKVQLGQSPDESGNPMTTDPMTTDPMTTDPMTTDPMTTNPMPVDPMQTDPMTTDPMTTDPMTTDPMTTDPMTTEKPTPTAPENPTPAPAANTKDPAEKAKPAPAPVAKPGI